MTLTKMLWTRPKRFGPDQNDWYSNKMIWTVQIHFGLQKFRAIEGQGMNKDIIIGMYHLDNQVCTKESKGGLKFLNRNSMVLSTIL